MAINYATLKTEIQNDPAGIGYAAFVTAENDAGLAGALNLVRAGASYSIFKSSIPIKDVIANIVAADFATLTTLQIEKLQLLFAGNTSGLDATDLNTRSIILGIFSGMTTTVSNLTTLAKRQGSRAEVLFGMGTVITDHDIGRARND